MTPHTPSDALSEDWRNAVSDIRDKEADGVTDKFPVMRVSGIEHGWSEPDPGPRRWWKWAIAILAIGGLFVYAAGVLFGWW